MKDLKEILLKEEKRLEGIVLRTKKTDGRRSGRKFAGFSF